MEPTRRFTGEYAVVQSNPVYFTNLVFLICGVMLLYEFSLSDWEAEDISLNPSYGPSSEVLEEAGAKKRDLIVDDGEWWRLITRE